MELAIYNVCGMAVFVILWMLWHWQQNPQFPSKASSSRYLREVLYQSDAFHIFTIKAPNGIEINADYWEVIHKAPGGDEAFTNQINEVSPISSAIYNFYSKAIESRRHLHSATSGHSWGDIVIVSQDATLSPQVLSRSLLWQFIHWNYTPFDGANTGGRRIHPLLTRLLRRACVFDSIVAALSGNMFTISGWCLLHCWVISSRTVTHPPTFEWIYPFGSWMCFHILWRSFKPHWRADLWHHRSFAFDSWSSEAHQRTEPHVQATAAPISPHGL